MDRIIVGIAGGTGSGKTTLVRRLAEYFGDRALVISHDDYYRRRDELSMEERALINYDEPAAYETDLLIEQLHALKEGKTVQAPVYDFSVHNRSSELRELSPRPVIIVEGIMILADERLRRELDLKVFVDTDADVRLGRRIKRDVRKRGRSIESVLEQYLATVKPMHDLYVEPSKKEADVIIPKGGKNPLSVGILASYVERVLSESKA